MDKETLSNYGWIVICVLVLAVMIALATPFGSFISEAIQSTTKGLFDVNKSALDSTGLTNIDSQEFDVPDMNHGAENTVAMIEFTINETTYQAEEGMTWGEWVASDYNTDGFRIGGGVICDSGFGTVKPFEYEGVQPMVSDDELIKANTLYICNSGGGRV